MRASWQQTKEPDCSGWKRQIWKDDRVGQNANEGTQIRDGLDNLTDQDKVRHAAGLVGSKGVGNGIGYATARGNRRARESHQHPSRRSASGPAYPNKPRMVYIRVRNSDLEAKKLFAGMVVKTTEPNDQEPLEETQQRMPEREVMRLMTLQREKLNGSSGMS